MPDSLTLNREIRVRRLGREQRLAAFSKAIHIFAVYSIAEVVFMQNIRIRFVIQFLIYIFSFRWCC